MSFRCWEWTGSLTEGGYGQFTVACKTHLVHRFSWMLANKRDIPRGLCTLHRCDNRKCVRPSHLQLGTQKENIQDAIKKGRMGFPGEDNSNAKLSDEQVKEIRGCYAQGGYTQKDIGEAYGVSQMQISKIVRFEQRN